MASIDTAPVFAHRSATLVQVLRALFLSRRATPPADPAEACARRAFLLEMADRNPDAFACDLDVQAMMQHYPGRF